MQGVQQHNGWMSQSTGRTLDIMHIPLLVKAALMKVATSENIVNAFKTTGIIPFNPREFKESDYCSLDVDETYAEASVIERTFDEEEQRRIFLVDYRLQEMKLIPHPIVCTQNLQYPVIATSSQKRTIARKKNRCR